MTPAEMTELDRLFMKLRDEYIHMQAAFHTVMTRREDVDIEYSKPCDDRH